VARQGTGAVPSKIRECATGTRDHIWLMTTDTTATDHAARFRQLHETGVLVLPNAWDAASARLIEDAGAQAIATTSAGVAWSLGRAGWPSGSRCR
jgi:Phosphoenolpyruvate phosphomutase